jgi:hypothetical protein
MTPDRDTNKSAIRLKKQVFGYHEILVVLWELYRKIRKKMGGGKLGWCSVSLVVWPGNIDYCVKDDLVQIGARLRMLIDDCAAGCIRKVDW